MFAMVLVVVCDTDLHISSDVCRMIANNEKTNHNNKNRGTEMDTTTHHVMVNVLAMLTAATLHIDWDNERFDNLFNKVYAELNK